MVLSFFQLNLSPPAGQMTQCHVNVFDAAALFFEIQILRLCAHTRFVALARPPVVDGSTATQPPPALDFFQETWTF